MSYFSMYILKTANNSVFFINIGDVCIFTFLEVMILKQRPVRATNNKEITNHQNKISVIINDRKLSGV